MYKRLINKQPTYDINKYIKEYELNQYYMQNVCKFPYMNFYKEKEYNKDKYIFSFSVERNKKRKSKIMSRANSDFFPKITNSITTRHSSRNNTLEEFGYKKIIKGRKKKFKNFTLNDLKNLKIKKNKNKLFFDLMIPNKINNYYYKNADSNNNKENGENNLNSENNLLFDDKIQI